MKHGTDDYRWLGLAVIFSTAIAASGIAAPIPDEIEAWSERSETGLVSMHWETTPGFVYRLRSSTDLQSWSEVAQYYGVGQQFSVPVAQFPESGDPGDLPDPPPVSNVVSAYFLLHPFSENQKTLVSWRDGTEVVHVLVDLDFSDLATIPFLVDEIEDATTGISYALTFPSMHTVWSPQIETLYGNPSLTQDQADYLAILTDHYAELHQAMEDVLANPGGDESSHAQPPDAGGGGMRAWYSVSREHTDSDGDGIFDHHEWNLTGSNAFLSDTDFDGVDDGIEVKSGYDPSVPGPGGGGGRTEGGEDPPVDSDGDQMFDALDFDFLDANIDWRNSVKPHYATSEVSGSSSYYPAAVNNKGEVLLNPKNPDPGSAPAVWTPGDSAPTGLNLGQLTADLRVYNGEFDVDGDPLTEVVTLDILKATASDINDNGVVVGQATFGVSSSNSSSSAISATLVTAVRWNSVGASSPQIVHPGKKEFPTSDPQKADMLLISNAHHINNDGEIVGEASVHFTRDMSGETVDDEATVPVRWGAGATEEEGMPIYTPTEETEYGGAKPQIDILSLAENGWVTGSSESEAAIWSTWQLEPTDRLADGGVWAFELEVMPNDRHAVVCSSRIMLEDEGGSWVGSVRPVSGRHVTVDGTIVTNDNKLLHAAEEWDFDDLALGTTLQNIIPIDVSGRGMMLVGQETGNALLMVPMVIHPQVVPVSGVGRIQIGLLAADPDQIPDLDEGSMPSILFGGEDAEDVVQDKVDLRYFYLTPPESESATSTEIEIDDLTVPDFPFLDSSTTFEIVEGVEYTEDVVDAVVGTSESVGAAMSEAFSMATGSEIPPDFSGYTQSEIFMARMSQIGNLAMGVAKAFFDEHEVTTEAEDEFDSLVSENNKRTAATLTELEGTTESESENASEGPAPVANPTLGSATFFADVRTWMHANSKRIFTGVFQTDARFAVVEANDFDLTAHTETTAGNNIYDAMTANPNAKIIINGALFNFKTDSNVTTGKVFSDGVELATSVTPGDAGHKAATLRYWFGQTVDNSVEKNGGTGASFDFGGKGHPPVVAGSTAPNDIHSAVGGLVSLIWPDPSGNRKKVTVKDDSDLKVYTGFLGPLYGYGAVGIDRDTGMLIILSKANRKSLSIFDVQDALFDSGIDRALVTDGGSSVALAIDGSVVIKGRRHFGGVSMKETVTNYMAFTPIPVVEITEPVDGASWLSGAGIVYPIEAAAKGGSDPFRKLNFSMMERRLESRVRLRIESHLVATPMGCTRSKQKSPIQMATRRRLRLST